ncbi:hypothetical protein [Bradyrhizobium sp.]|uniref:hypothetical protein n=1 Tax=Bradyrhizobium sp. TaxID=376 RepID=UPI003C717363
MDLKRLSILLIWLGAMLVLAGAFSWGARMPEEAWLKEGYYHCLWASSYRVTSEIKPDFLNPLWNADKASCTTARADSLVNFAEDGKRVIARITTGVDPGPAVHEQPPFFLMTPFLNSAGFIVVLLGSIIAITRSGQVSGAEITQQASYGSRFSSQLDPAGYDLKKWNALLQYDADIKRVADALAPYGQKYLDQFAEAFMAINDKNYLPQIIRTILESAKLDAARVPIEDRAVEPGK